MLERILEGRFAYHTRDASVERSRGTVTVVPPGVEHRRSRLQPGKMLVCHLNCVGRAAADFIAGIRGRVAETLPNSESDPVGRHLGACYALALAEPTPLWQAERMARHLDLWLAEALEACLDLTSWRVESTLTVGTRNSGRLAHELAIEFMRSNCDQPLRVADIAAHAGVSPRHLARLFRTLTGRSVNDTLVRLRLEKARSLLEGERVATVKEVAYLCGFSSPAYFTQCFRRAYDRVPSSLLRP